MTFILLTASAVLSALGLIFPQLCFLSWFSLTPFIYVMINGCEKRLSLPRAYLYGFIWFLFYYVVIYHWFIYLYPMEFIGVTPVQGAGIVALCWIGLSLLQTVLSAFMTMIFRLCTKRKALIPLLFSSVWVIFEYLQTLTWAGVPWARLALSQVPFLPAIQSASLFGSLFISFIIVLVNAYLALAFKAFKENGISHRSVRIYALVAVLIFGSNLIFGALRLILHKDNKDNTISVALIQGNVSSSDKWDLSGVDSLELYTEMTLEASKEADLDIVLWPETVINFSLLENTRYCDKVCTLAKEADAIIYVGTFVGTFSEDKEYLEHNALVAFYPDGSIEQDPYFKRHLVPFGEYLPMADFFETFIPPLAGLNLMGNDLTPGDDSRLSHTEHGTFGRLICFDSIYQELARDSTRDGAQLLLLSTNDSWYMDSSAVIQHNSHACLRAVENGRWVLRAANTGISSVISSEGKTITHLDALTKGYIVENAYTHSERTLYSYIGDTIVLLCFGITLFEGASVIFKKRR